MTKLRDENSKLATELAESKKAAKTAKQDLAKWQSKAEKAEKNVEKAEKTLEKALQEHSATQSALIQANSHILNILVSLILTLAIIFT